MQFPTILISLMAIVPSVLAVPAPASSPIAVIIAAVDDSAVKERDLTARTTVVVTQCTDANFGGQCISLTTTLGVCSTFPSANFGTFNDQVSSVFVADGRACTFFIDQSCQGGSVGISSISNLNDGGGFNDAITSWRC